MNPQPLISKVKAHPLHHSCSRSVISTAGPLYRNILILGPPQINTTLLLTTLFAWPKWFLPSFSIPSIPSNKPPPNMIFQTSFGWSKKVVLMQRFFSFSTWTKLWHYLLFKNNHNAYTDDKNCLRSNSFRKYLGWEKFLVPIFWSTSTSVTTRWPLIFFCC